MKKNIKINTETIKLQQFLKWMGLAETGGQAKELIFAGKVKVNGKQENKPGKQLVPGDLIEVDHYRIEIF